MGSLFNRAMNLGVSVLWSAGTALARKRRGGRARLPARVVSVGNIQVGGAGKTPLVAYLAQQAIERGKSVCILTRGYGSKWEKSGGVIAPLSLSGESQADALLCGDEAALLHDRVPEAWIGVGADRAAQFEALQKQAERAGRLRIDWVILDDGFQHHRLVKDLEIVAVTSARPGQKIFRDFRGALKKADLLVWTKGEERPDTWGRPAVRARMELAPAQEKGPFLLVTGVADGVQAKETIERAGYSVAKHLSFPDHARYAPAVIDTILEEARKAHLKVALTGKDWVKWRGLQKALLREPVVVLEPTVKLDPADEKIWNEIVWGK